MGTRRGGARSAGSRRTTERLVERIAAVPINQLIMVKLAMNSALLNQGVATSAMISTVFDGIARHTPEGHAFVADAREHGFREAVRHRDEPFGDHGRKAVRGLRDADAFADDGPLGRAERAARGPPGLGHREPNSSGSPPISTSGADGAGGADADGERGRPGALRGWLPPVGPAAGQPAPPGLRDQSTAAKWEGAWTTLVMTSVGTDARTRAALRTTLHHNRFGELRKATRPSVAESNFEKQLAAINSINENKTTRARFFIQKCIRLVFGRDFLYSLPLKHGLEIHLGERRDVRIFPLFFAHLWKTQLLKAVKRAFAQTRTPSSNRSIAFLIRMTNTSSNSAASPVTATPLAGRSQAESPTLLGRCTQHLRGCDYGLTKIYAAQNCPLRPPDGAQTSD